MRQIKYWGSYFGMTCGLTLASALLMTVISLLRGGMAELTLTGIGMYCIPYLFFAGLFCMSFSLLSCFQVYAPTILAMGCTRKRFLVEVLAVALTEALILVSVSAVLGRLDTGAMAETIQAAALAGMLGVVLIVMAAFLLFGAMIFVFGRKGILAMMLLYMVIGAAFGAMAGMGTDLDTVTMQDMLNGATNLWSRLLPAGCVLFCLCGAIVWLVLRRYEVRS